MYCSEGSCVHSQAGQKTETKSDFMLDGGTFAKSRFCFPISSSLPLVIASRCQPWTYGLSASSGMWHHALRMKPTSVLHSARAASRSLSSFSIDALDCRLSFVVLKLEFIFWLRSSKSQPLGEEPTKLSTFIIAQPHHVEARVHVHR